MNLPMLKRKKAVQHALDNERLEGLQVSRESRKIADNYVVGKISAKAAAAQIKARYSGR